MFKVLLTSLAIVCCGAQLDIPKRFDQLRFAQLQGAPVPLVEAPVAIQEEAVAIAPAPAVAAVAQPVGQIQLRSIQQLASPIWNSFRHIRTQEVLPIQDLDVRAGPEVLHVKSDEQPVLVHFQTQSVPVHVETSHIPSPPQEVTVTQTQDEPHRVIHEVIRPIIQEVREIIQPYRRVTQEIRPVQEEVHTAVSAGAPAAAQVAPAQTVVAAPTVVRAEAPSLVTAPAQAVYGSPLQYAYAAQPQQVVERSNLGVISAPSPYYTGSYIQAFIEQLRARREQTPVYESQPNVAVEAAPVYQSVAVEPVAAEAVAPAAPIVATQKLVSLNRGSLKFTQKHREY